MHSNMFHIISIIVMGLVVIAFLFGKMPIVRLMCLLMFLLPPIIFLPLVHLYMLFDKTTNYKCSFKVSKE